ncbi:cAMP-dependent protein kinase, catalytic subunit-like [Ceratocystis lukuohia]|uniref:non-specific serine/threonine protein kinase n=1 Tax=Ceratocystis lukuohia TaxID=2019550 RepID=A0ABR4MTS0_9PEZI
MAELSTSRDWEKTQAFTSEENRSILEVLKKDRERQNSVVVPPYFLDDLLVEDHHRESGIRTLIQPVDRKRSVSFHESSCTWINLKPATSPQGDIEHEVLAVTQTEKDIKFIVQIPGQPNEPNLLCELYYDPGSDYQILLNRSSNLFSLARLSRDSDDDCDQMSRPTLDVWPGATRSLQPGTWRILIAFQPIVDFRILPKAPIIQYPCPQGSQSRSADRLPSDQSLKRKRSVDQDEGREIALRPPHDESNRKNNGVVIKFLQPVENPVSIFLPTPGDEPEQPPRPSAPSGDPHPPAKSKSPPETNANQGLILTGNALRDLPVNYIAHINAYQKDEYRLMRRDDLVHNSALSHVFKADHSNKPEYIMVKILNTIDHKRPDNRKNIISQAITWERELRHHIRLKHDSIVRMVGGDARFLALYMEPVNAPDLGSAQQWRDKNNMFTGKPSNARQILRQTADALEYIQAQGLVHNDIKPSNILYSVKTGAMLCDFGLASTVDESNNHQGGTPWYVPIEYLAHRRRGPPGDIWALGIVMLYLIRKIPLPETQHKQYLTWIIRDVHRNDIKPTVENEPQSARNQMQLWLDHIKNISSTLDERDPLEKLVSLMLRRSPTNRITAKSMMGILKAPPKQQQQQQQQQSSQPQSPSQIQPQPQPQPQ